MRNVVLVFVSNYSNEPRVMPVHGELLIFKGMDRSAFNSLDDSLFYFSGDIP